MQTRHNIEGYNYWGIKLWANFIIKYTECCKNIKLKEGIGNSDHSELQLLEISEYEGAI